MNEIERLEHELVKYHSQIVGGTSEGLSEKLKVDPPFDRQEAEDFLLGLDSGLFALGRDGYIQSSFLPPARRNQPEQRAVQLFWHRKEGRRILFREGVCQLAAAVALIRRYGWPLTNIRLEPYKEDIGDVQFGVDLVVAKGDEGFGYICGEVKKNARDLEKMLSELQECGKMGEHEKEDCGRLQHSKYAACIHLRPVFFWAVSPGVRRSFSVEYSGTKLSMKEIDDIPEWDS